MSRRRDGPPPRPPAVQGGEPGHERQADPGSGAARTGGAPLAERLEDHRLHPLGDPGALVLDREQNTVLASPHLDKHRSADRRVLRGVDKKVLEDPLDLPGVHRQDHRIRHDPAGMIGKEIGFVDDTPRERAKVGRLAFRLDQAPIEPVQIEQVGHHAIQLAPTGRDGVEQAGALLRRELKVLPPLEGLDRTEYGGDRATKIVRDRVQ